MHMQFIIFSIVLAVATCSSSIDWFKFKRDFNKSYKSAAEEAERKAIFLENVIRMRTYKNTHPNATFTMAINHLSDRRIDELVTDPQYFAETYEKPRRIPVKLVNYPDSFDWRTKGVITPVENQGALGDVQAIASVEVVESLFAVKTGKIVEGSVARVVDCCPQPNDPFTCIQKLGGICTASDYPQPTGQCKPNACKPFTSFDKIMRLKNQDEDTMVAWIQDSPLYVGIDASQISFQMYQAGIYADQSCSKTVIDHAMQLVGYGKTASGDLFWICKNSWGISWGEKGYIRVLRGKNTCGIASSVVHIV